MDTIERTTDTTSPAPANPLALDPFSPIAPLPGLREDTRVPADPLALDPLQPIAVARPHPVAG